MINKEQKNKLEMMRSAKGIMADSLLAERHQADDVDEVGEEHDAQ